MAYLRSALSEYSFADVTKQEVINVLQTFTDLRPTIQKYTFNDGAAKDLLCLAGTIQVNYKGKTYNIPIESFLMDSHPYNPPIVYVKPTANMLIKASRHVDSSGLIYLPYLNEWKHPQSDIVGLLQVMSIVFGDEPPVFAKPGAGTGTSSGTQAPYSDSSSSDSDSNGISHYRQSREAKPEQKNKELVVRRAAGVSDQMLSGGRSALKALKLGVKREENQFKHIEKSRELDNEKAKIDISKVANEHKVEERRLKMQMKKEKQDYDMILAIIMLIIGVSFAIYFMYDKTMLILALVASALALVGSALYLFGKHRGYI